MYSFYAGQGTSIISSMGKIGGKGPLQTANDFLVACQWQKMLCCMARSQMFLRKVANKTGYRLEGRGCCRTVCRSLDLGFWSTVPSVFDIDNEIFFHLNCF